MIIYVSYSSIMEGEQSLQRFSPELTVQHPDVRCAAHLLPRIVLFHGTADYSIPSDARLTTGILKSVPILIKNLQ